MPYGVPSEVVADIMSDSSHAAAFSSITAPYVMRNAGYAASSIKPLVSISKKQYYYIGISKSTPKHIADAWQEAFNKLSAEGKIASIMKRWVK